MNAKDLVGPIQLAIYIFILLLSMGVAYARITDRLSVAEEKINATKTDHDLIVTIAQKVNAIEADVKELKDDVKRFTRTH